MAVSLPISFFLSPAGLVEFVAVGVVGDVVAVAATEAVVDSPVAVFVVLSAVVFSASLGFLFGTSFSPLDSDSVRLVGAFESSVLLASAA